MAIGIASRNKRLHMGKQAGIGEALCKRTEVCSDV